MLDLRFRPSSWASPVPFGLGLDKPRHFRDMLRVAWRNRDEATYAWRILRDGVCDGCALGTTGMRDHTLDGTHLCNVRLELLRLNTMGALAPEIVDALGDLEASGLLGRTGAELRELGRLPYPMVRERGNPGFRRASWEEVAELLGARLRLTSPERAAFYLTSRGLTNETYYVAQKVARYLGTNHIDNSARICHAPSTTALSRSIGVAASTCSYADWIGTDLLILIGTDLPNNQPVATKYIYHAKAEGTCVVSINPFREPGLERYWIPSISDSAVFGTRITDRWFHPRQGGDTAFLGGVLKALLERDGVDEDFVRERTSGFDEVRDDLGGRSWHELERLAGVERSEMEELARMYHEARTAVFVWSMGLTQHRFGADNVHAVVNLALARGMIGRPRTGLVPIRGHSGVQGGAEVGAVPWTLPGGVPVGSIEAERLEELWGFPLPRNRGLSAVETVDAAHRREIDLLWSVGGDVLATLPDPEYCREALERVPVRVHQDIVLTHPMFVDPAEVVVLLPATTRYEMPGGGTETTTERRIYFSPEIPGRRIGEARPEWEVLCEVAARARPDTADRIRFADTAAIRAEIARAVPSYDGIQHLARKGDQFQWGGPRLCEDGTFETGDGRARFRVAPPAEQELPEGWFHMSTRRGKQFNSMVQARRDPLTGADREAVFVAREDADRLGLRDGEPVLVRNPHGELRGRVKRAELRAGNVQLHWPEGNVLVPRGVVEPESGIPDFNAPVELVPIGPDGAPSGPSGGSGGTRGPGPRG